MSSVECLREFVNERLTAAAEEIFRVFKQTIFEYEEEIGRQRRLLDIVWKPEIQLRKIKLPKLNVCKEEKDLTEQQLCAQETNSSLGQEEPESPQIKEEQEELCSSQGGKQFELKLETETFMLTHTDNSKPKPKLDHQLLSNSNSRVAESQNHQGGEHKDSGLPGNVELKPQTSDLKSKSHSNVYSPNSSEMHCSTGKKSTQCHLCGKDFRCMSKLIVHMRIHTGEKPYPCNICGRSFKQTSALKAHRRIHTGERPYSCNTCGKSFIQPSVLKAHLRTHTGERPYACEICGRDFKYRRDVTDHMRRTHTGDKPHI